MTNEERLQIFEEVDPGCITDALICFKIGAWMQGIFPVSKKAKIYGLGLKRYLTRGKS